MTSYAITTRSKKPALSSNPSESDLKIFASTFSVGSTGQKSVGLTPEVKQYNDVVKSFLFLFIGRFTC